MLKFASAKDAIVPSGPRASEFDTMLNIIGTTVGGA